jgi:hypothetical protein
MEHKDQVDLIKDKYKITVNIDEFIDSYGDDYDKIDRLLSQLYIRPTRSFSLHSPIEQWDTNYVIQCYRNGIVDIEYVSKCFYYNSSMNRVQTVNIKNGKRVIEDIGLELLGLGLIPSLDCCPTELLCLHGKQCTS